MGRVKEQQMDLETAIEVFGDFRHKFIIASDEPVLREGDYVALVNANCEFEFDSINGVFQSDLLYYYIVDLQLKDIDLSNYQVEKSNNGGGYGFCTCRVLKVHGKSY